MYFKKVKEGQEVFGLVFGHGVVNRVQEDCFYSFFVEFDNGFEVPYTPEGYPAWGNLSFQTVFYKEDIDLMEMDFSPSDKLLTPKKIIKLRAKNKLEVKCPSGIWQPVDKCPSYVTERYLEDNKLSYFRKVK